MPQTRSRIVAVWCLACLLWSVGWLFLKIGVRDVPPLSFAALRLALAFAALAIIVTFRKEWFTLRVADAPTIAVSGLLLLGVNYALTFWGAQFLSSALTSVLQATSPVFGFLIGTAAGAERFTASRALALAVGVLGVGLVSYRPFGMGDPAGVGSIAVVTGAACAAAAYAIVKKSGMHLPPTVLSAAQTLVALLPLSLAAVLVDGNPVNRTWTVPAVLALLYLTLGLASSVAAFWLNYWLLRRVTTTTVLSMALVQPLVAAVLGYLVLGERLGPHAAAGGVCILVCAAVVLRAL